MNKKQIQKRLSELNKVKNWTDETIREVTYLERQLERIIENETV